MIPLKAQEIVADLHDFRTRDGRQLRNVHVDVNGFFVGYIGNVDHRTERHVLLGTRVQVAHKYSWAHGPTRTTYPVDERYRTLVEKEFTSWVRQKGWGKGRIEITVTDDEAFSRIKLQVRLLDARR